LHADTKKVYFYTAENNIKDFKLLKVSFEKYLEDFGDYTFQPFSEKKMFEKYLKDKSAILLLSSWHYKQISKKYNISAKLVALKKQSITDTKIIVGKKGLKYNGTITTAYSKDFAKETINKLTKNNNLNILNVPKEIDALMSVGFGMSKFALVSKDSFELLKDVNSFLAKQLKIYSESEPTFRMLVASKIKDKYNKKTLEVFTDMASKDKGKKVLEILGIDNIVVLSNNNLIQLGDIK
jgi:hypothetical protein